MEYKLKMTGNFKRDVKRCQKRGYPLNELWTVIGKLLRGETLPAKYRVHMLHSDHHGEWECHIQPDLLLVWEQHDDELVLLMLNTGTHSDIFGKKKK